MSEVAKRVPGGEAQRLPPILLYWGRRFAGDPRTEHQPYCYTVPFEETICGNLFRTVQ